MHPCDVHLEYKSRDVYLEYKFRDLYLEYKSREEYLVVLRRLDEAKLHALAKCGY